MAYGEEGGGRRSLGDMFIKTTVESNFKSKFCLMEYFRRPNSNSVLVFGKHLNRKNSVSFSVLFEGQVELGGQLSTMLTASSLQT